MRTNRIAAVAFALALGLTVGCGGDKDTKNTASDAYNKRMSGSANPEDRRDKTGPTDPGKDGKDEKKDDKK
jgi:hypothetical protein